MYSEKMGSTTYHIEGPSLNDCKNTLYKRYGTNYQIISFTTVLKGGFLGFGQKEIVRVDYMVNPAPVQTQPLQSSRPVSNQNSENISVYNKSSSESFAKARDEILKKTDASVTNTLQLAKIQESIQELSQTLSGMKENGYRNENEKHESILKIEKILDANEFTPEYIKGISERIRSEFSLDELEDFDQVEETVFDWIGESISIAEDVTYRPPHVTVIIGPTGVGKTTTVAKMAANMVLRAKRADKPIPEVRMITVDNMRVGAEEQLKKYGEIMHVPVDKAEYLDDLKKEFERYKDHVDELLIDTSGFSPNDYDNIAKMRGLLNIPGMRADVYLAVSACTKAKDLENILRNYESFNFRSVIITKCDETTSMGNILSVLSQKNKAISWITNGQQVPRYIEKASVLYFMKNMEGFNISRDHMQDKFGMPKDEK